MYKNSRGNGCGTSDNGVSTPQNHALLLRRAPNTSTCMGFSRRNKIPRCRVAVHTLWEKGIRFRHPDYDPDRAQKLISLSMSLVVTLWTCYGAL